ncbi:MAG: class II aldolase/adducin family protein, partial [Proteobacteria bacterium]|nr:class II aldolase/adducin family protein [Pseudomonadota bacterium]
ETGLHAAIYNNLSSRAIVHVHPAFTLTLTDSACDLKPITLEAAIFLGTVPIIPQEAPNVTDTASVVASFTLNNIVILKNHGIVSVGETIWDAFFLAELLEEASHMTILSYLLAGVKRKREKAAVPKQLKAKPVKIFSKEHVSRLIKITNSNKKLQTLGKETHFSLSLGLRMQDQGVAYTLVFKDGKIVETKQGENKDTLVMAGSRAAWCAICNGIMDPFAASIQKKMEFGASIRDLSPWYPFFRSLFALWQTIPVTEGLAAIKI